MPPRKQLSLPSVAREIAGDLALIARGPSHTQLSLSTLPGPPAGCMVSGIDPSKDALNVAAIIGDGVSSALDLLRRARFVLVPWCTGIGWEQTVALFGGVGPDDMGTGWECARGYALCEAQWAGDDAKQKWSGLEALCQTAGALRAASVAAGLPMSAVSHWSRDGRGNKTPLPPPIMGMPAVYNTRGLGFIEPGAWRSVSLSPRPITPRLVVRRVEQRCAQEYFGRAVGEDFSAAFGILLCALGLNYSDLGVSV